ncbi:MAG: hypothetical protein ACRYF4_09870 [Janthinobacterium lividum]
MTVSGKNVREHAACWLSAVLLAASAATVLPAQIAAGGRFDLTGPRIDVHVQRGEKSLPIAMVPNLQPGDRLTIHADLPTTQSVKLILVVAFLRGSTNPPTEDFFTKVNTWDKKVRGEGVVVTVPKEAQQALLFLAPETGGDFSTLRSAVTGRPGVFVRAAQDLNEASFEQARIERYLQAIRRVPPGSPAELLDHSHKLAATLNLKPNEDCFKKPADLQLTCLRQTGGQVLLDDGHGQTLASMLASGDSANLIGAVAGTPMATAGGAGVYSAYIGTVIDVVRLLSGLHTAQFQYIPAIAFPDSETLNLRLNTPPSFHNPKSVIVVALPAIQPSVAPPLRLQDPGHVSCLLQPAMVLPLEGAPLVFATGFAHDLTLHLNGGTVGGKTDLPLVPDAYEGGLILASNEDRKPLAIPAEQPRVAGNPTVLVGKSPAATQPVESGDVQITGTLHGMWGFDSFEGVTVPLQRSVGSGWTAAPRSELFAGRSNQLVLHATGTACASQIDLDLPGKDDLKLDWRQAQASSADKSAPPINVKLPLEKTAPGSVSLLVHQFGTDAVDKVAVTAYSDQVRLSGLRIHAGDNVATLSGTGLNDVSEVKLDGVGYVPLPDQPADGKELRLSARPAEGSTQGKSKLSKPGTSGLAEATLKDGRRFPVNFTVDAPRPALEILNRSIKMDQTGMPLTLGSGSDLPLNARVTIALKSVFPARFARSEKVEIALTDGSLRTVLSLADGSLVLQDAQTALAFLSPAKAFGTSAFGPLQMRALMEDGTVGDWTPLGTLIRTPTISTFACVRSTPHSQPVAVPDAALPVETGCSITGSNLFLIGSISADSSFTAGSAVPLGFTGEALSVPRPADNHTLYLKLRDDPAAVVTLTSLTPSTVSVRRPVPAAGPLTAAGN